MSQPGRPQFNASEGEIKELDDDTANMIVDAGSGVFVDGPPEEKSEDVSGDGGDENREESKSDSNDSPHGDSGDAKPAPWAK